MELAVKVAGAVRTMYHCLIGAAIRLQFIAFGVAAVGKGHST